MVEFWRLPPSLTSHSYLATLQASGRKAAAETLLNFGPSVAKASRALPRLLRLVQKAMGGARKSWDPTIFGDFHGMSMGFYWDINGVLMGF